MKFIIKLFPEITIKSDSLRKQLIKQLCNNIRKICKAANLNLSVIRSWDSIYVNSLIATDSHNHLIVEKLRNIPGICYILEVVEFPLTTLEQAADEALKIYHDQLINKTFAVRVKRNGKHSFSSVEAEKQIGGTLLKKIKATKVNLTSPDVLIQIEIKNNQFYIIANKYDGLGGFPLGSQNSVLSLISGGFDSSVASFLTMRRGIITHFCFFNLGGHLHEMGTKEIAYYLWKKYAGSQEVRFITVPFQNVVKNILSNVDPSLMGVILKRMMVRAASSIAQKLKINALLTGEAIAQVSSQTLPNLSTIDAVADLLILRPLIVMDKQDIIGISRHIGTENFSKKIPEYCAVISKKPKTAVTKNQADLEEKKLDFSILDTALNLLKNEKVSQLVLDDEEHLLDQIKIVANLEELDVVVDVRHPSERYSKVPMPDTRSDSKLEIPFYALESQFKKLDATKRYLLYCDQGVISRLHAVHLFKDGYQNIAVYLPTKT